ncbi:MAG: PAS domain-containing protein [Gallionella sp.]
MTSVKKNNAVIETNAASYAVGQEWTNEHPAEWYEPPALALDERGMIRDCSKSGERLFGYRRHDLVWQHVSMLFPQLSGIVLVQEGRFNPLLNFLCRCGKLFQSRNRQGDAFSCNLSFVRLEHDGIRTLRLIVSPSDNAKS